MYYKIILWYLLRNLARIRIFIFRVNADTNCFQMMVACVMGKEMTLSLFSLLDQGFP